MFPWPPPLKLFPHHPPLLMYMNAHTKLTHTLAPASIHLSMFLLLNNISKSKTLEVSPPVHISPDSRSSELERRSRSNDRDLSRSLPLVLSTEGDFSLSSQSLYSGLSSRHPSWDSERSFSWVWDVLSLEDLRKNPQQQILTPKKQKTSWINKFQCPS